MPSSWRPFVGGLIEKGGDVLRHLAETGDLVSETRRREVETAGGYHDALGHFVLVPKEVQSGFVHADPELMAKATAPVARHLTDYGQAFQPTKPNKGDRFLRGAGHLALGLPTLAAPPLAAAYYFADGYGSANEDARSHGASPDTAQGVGLVNGLLQAGLASAPGLGSTVLGRYVTSRVANPILQAAARTAAAGGTGGVYGALSQTASNAIAKFSYDPDRGLGDGVPEAALTAGVLGLAGHATTEVGAPLWRSNSRPVRARVSAPYAPQTLNDTPQLHVDPEPVLAIPKDAQPPGVRAPESSRSLPATSARTQVARQSDTLVHPLADLSDLGAAVHEQTSSDLQARAMRRDEGQQQSDDFADLGDNVTGVGGDREEPQSQFDDLGGADVDASGAPAMPTSASLRVNLLPEEVYDVSTVGRTAEERADIIEHFKELNAMVDSAGRGFEVRSTKGQLSRRGRRAARAEKRARRARGTPFDGQPGHWPDVALTGLPIPPKWHDMRGASNQIIGGGLASRIGQTLKLFTVDGEMPQ